MNSRTLMRKACFVLLLSTTLFSGACSSREDRAQAAFDNYQAALVAGNVPSLRAALLQLVAVDDDNPQYWIELGRVQLQLGAYPDAYYAFTRAYELDRSSAEVLRILTQLALRAGDLAVADEHAEQLSLLLPDDPTVKITRAYVALRRSDTVEAERVADELLAASPYEAAPKILKARIMLRTGRGDQAVQMLEEQVRQQPGDLDSLFALVGILDRRDEWAKVAAYGGRLFAQQPGNLDIALLTIGGALRSGDVETARRVSSAALRPELNSRIVSDVLDQWVNYGPPRAFVTDAERLAAAAPPAQKATFGAYLNRAGAPDAAARVVSAAATMPVTAENDDANAVLATSLGLRGQTAQALERFARVLETDPNHLEALAGRARLLVSLGRLGPARLDAQRLASLAPGEPRAHILLSDVYAALGDREQSRRVLWTAFHQISADRNIYEALRVLVSRVEGTEAAQRIDEEFAAQRDAKLTREFI